MIVMQQHLFQFFQQGDPVFTTVQDYVKNFQAVFVKPCRIMMDCYEGKNQFNFGPDAAQNG